MTRDSLSGDAAKIFPVNYPVLDVCPLKVAAPGGSGSATLIRCLSPSWRENNTDTFEKGLRLTQNADDE